MHCCKLLQDNCPSCHTLHQKACTRINHTYKADWTLRHVIIQAVKHERTTLTSQQSTRHCVNEASDCLVLMLMPSHSHLHYLHTTQNSTRGYGKLHLCDGAW